MNEWPDGAQPPGPAYVSAGTDNASAAVSNAAALATAEAVAASSYASASASSAAASAAASAYLFEPIVPRGESLKRHRRPGYTTSDEEEEEEEEEAPRRQRRKLLPISAMPGIRLVGSDSEPESESGLLEPIPSAVTPPTNRARKRLKARTLRHRILYARLTNTTADANYAYQRIAFANRAASDAADKWMMSSGSGTGHTKHLVELVGERQTAPIYKSHRVLARMAAWTRLVNAKRSLARVMNSGAQALPQPLRKTRVPVAGRGGHVVLDVPWRTPPNFLECETRPAGGHGGTIESTASHVVRPMPGPPVSRDDTHTFPATLGFKMDALLADDLRGLPEDAVRAMNAGDPLVFEMIGNLSPIRSAEGFEMLPGLSFADAADSLINPGLVGSGEIGRVPPLGGGFELGPSGSIFPAAGDALRSLDRDDDVFGLFG